MSIPISDKFKPKGIGGFALVDAEDIEYKGGRLPDFLPELISQEDYNALEQAGDVVMTKPYFVPKGSA